MSTQVRFVPIVCDGHSASATIGSRTTARIFERANSCAVRFAVGLGEQVGEGVGERVDASATPTRLVGRAALLGRRVERRALGGAIGTPAVALAGAATALVVAGHDLAQLRGIERSVHRGHRVVGRALEHDEVVGLLRDPRDGLASRSSRCRSRRRACRADRRPPAASARCRTSRPRSPPARRSPALDRREVADGQDEVLRGERARRRRSRRPSARPPRSLRSSSCRAGCRDAGRTGPRRARGSAGSPAAWRSAGSIPILEELGRETRGSSRCSRMSQRAPG